MNSPPNDLASSPARSPIVRPRWRGAILVCGKCAKKHEDGKAIRRALKDEASRRLAPAAGKPAGKRKVKIIKTACLGLCPKNAVVVASAATLAAGEVVLLRGSWDVAGTLPRLLPPDVAPPDIA